MNVGILTASRDSRGNCCLRAEIIRMLLPRSAQETASTVFRRPSRTSRSVLPWASHPAQFCRSLSCLRRTAIRVRFPAGAPRLSLFRAIILRRNSYLLRSDRSFSEKGGHSTFTAHVRKGRFESIQDIRTASGEGEQNDSATKSPHYPRARQRKVGPFSCWYPGAGSRTAVGAFPAGDHQQWRHAGFLR